ncbi:hypothetical protein BpHYR1_004867, partial [Brachionus plicatilis]
KKSKITCLIISIQWKKLKIYFRITTTNYQKKNYLMQTKPIKKLQQNIYSYKKILYMLCFQNNEQLKK